MNTEIQHDKAAAVEQHIAAILAIAHAEDTTDSMRRWIAEELHDVIAYDSALRRRAQTTASPTDIETAEPEIAGAALPTKPLTDPTAARPAGLSDEEYESYALRHAAHIRQYSGQPFVPVRRTSGRIDWRYPTGHVRGTATLTFTKRAP